MLAAFLIILVIFYLTGSIVLTIKEYKNSNSAICAGGIFLLCLIATPLFGWFFVDKD